MSSTRDQRTEPASAQRRKEARESGRFPSSRDLVAASSLVGVVLAARYGASGWAAAALGEWRGLLETSLETSVFDRDTVLAVVGSGAELVLLVFLPIGAILIVVVALASLAQSGFLLRPVGILPTFGRLSPNSSGGVFSLRSSLQGLLAVAKCAWLVACLWRTLDGLLSVRGSESVFWLHRIGSSDALSAAGEHLLSFASLVVQGFFLLGVVDWLLERHLMERDLRMSPQEVQEERAQQEVSGATRRSQRRFARRLLRDAAVEPVAQTPVTAQRALRP